MMKHPQILTLNLNRHITQALGEKFPLYQGSLGAQVQVPQSSDTSVFQLNARIPKNFHEYEIVIIDLTNEDVIEYVRDEQKKKNKSSNDSYFICHRPHSVFDPRAATLYKLKEDLIALIRRPSLLVIFCAPEENIKYELYANYEREYLEFELYHGFENLLSPFRNKNGRKTHVTANDHPLSKLLNDFNEDFEYHVVFDNLSENRHPDPLFHPLVFNNANEVVGYLHRYHETIVVCLPGFRDKGKFLDKFLTEVAPDIYPALFPENAKGSWLWSDAYALPNQSRLLKERLDLDVEYEQKKAAKDQEIAENHASFAFLHELLTATGDALVTAVIKYLEWLGFENVVDADTVNEGKDEDIQIETSEGLLIFEVKGVSNKAKDSDCGQIGKIRSRRQEDRGKFDVYGHFILNHQRHVPALDREHPPFTDNQERDARNERRGLMTTWQLFNLYFDVECGALTKEQARKAFYSYGLVDFIPQDFIPLGKANELLAQQTVVIINLPEHVNLAEGEMVLVKDNEGLHRLEIKSIRIDNNPVKTATNVEVGLKLNGTVKKGSEFYKIIE